METIQLIQWCLGLHVYSIDRGSMEPKRQWNRVIRFVSTRILASVGFHLLDTKLADKMQTDGAILRSRSD